MNDKVDSFDQVWERALGELQMQMTRATFDTWIRSTRPISCEDGVLVVGVHDGYAKDWIENRLRGLIERTVTDIAGHPLQVRFEVNAAQDVEGDGDGQAQAGVVQDADGEGGVVEERPAARPRRRFVVPDFDTSVAGWFKVTRYETLFWAPLLGRVAWRVREICLEADLRKDKSNNWTPPRRYTAPHLADLVPCGKQAVTGLYRRNGDGNLHHHPGAFDRLVELGLATVQKQGQPPHVIYVVSVVIRLPMMRPEQVGELPDRLQVRHDMWLEEHGFDSREWFANDEDGAS